MAELMAKIRFPTRLDKWLRDASVHTHTELHHLWTQGRIRYVPAEPYTYQPRGVKEELAELVVFPEDKVFLDGKLVEPRPLDWRGMVLAFYKPAGVECQLTPAPARLAAAASQPERAPTRWIDAPPPVIRAPKELSAEQEARREARKAEQMEQWAEKRRAKRQKKAENGEAVEEAEEQEEMPCALPNANIFGDPQERYPRRQPRKLEDFVNNMPPGVSLIGRLDKDTTGLILLTNCGDLSNLITKAYYEEEAEGKEEKEEKEPVRRPDPRRSKNRDRGRAHNVEVVTAHTGDLSAALDGKQWTNKKEYICTFREQRVTSPQEIEKRVASLVDGVTLNDGLAKALGVSVISHSRDIFKLRHWWERHENFEGDARTDALPGLEEANFIGDIWKVSILMCMGRWRVVRRMVAAAGFTRLEQLHRESIGPVSLESVGLQGRPGCAVMLEPEQLDALWASVGGLQAAHRKRFQTFTEAVRAQRVLPAGDLSQPNCPQRLEAWLKDNQITIE